MPVGVEGLCLALNVQHLVVAVLAVTAAGAICILLIAFRMWLLLATCCMHGSRPSPMAQTEGLPRKFLRVCKMDFVTGCGHTFVQAVFLVFVAPQLPLQRGAEPFRAVLVALGRRAIGAKLVIHDPWVHKQGVCQGILIVNVQGCGRPAQVLGHSPLSSSSELSVSSSSTFCASTFLFAGLGVSQRRL